MPRKILHKPKVQGNHLQLLEQPESPEYSFGKDKDTCTRTYKGHYEFLRVNRPYPFQLMTDLDERGFIVETVTLRGDKGGDSGILTVTLTRGANDEDNDSEVSKPVFEIEWSQVQQKLKLNDLFAKLTQKDFALGDGAVDAITGADADGFDKAYSDWLGTNGKVTGATDPVLLRRYVDMQLRGVTDFSLHSPVVRMTTKSNRPQTARPCDLRQVPPVQSGYPRGYEYLKTADRVTNPVRGQSDRTQEWTGALKIEPGLYKSGV